MTIAYFKTAKKLITGGAALTTLAAELSALGIQSLAIVTDQGVTRSGGLKKVLDQLSASPVTIIDDIPPEPEIGVIEAHVKRLKQFNVDGIIAVGGGSAMDSAKVLAVSIGHQGRVADMLGENNVSQRTIGLIAIPTTAGTGSEVTNIAILSDPIAQVKKGIVSDYLLPDVAIVSPEMTVSCPKKITAASGIDAFVHAIESYLSVNASEITDALAKQAMTLIYNALPKAFSRGNDLQAREDMATGSLLAGLAFGNAGVGAVHALAYPLGGRYHLSHGLSNAVMLPHVMRWNALACKQRFIDIAQLLNLVTMNKSSDEVIASVLNAIEALCRQVEIPARLRDFNIPEDELSLLASEASKVTRLLKNNPRELSVEDIEAIYRQAY